MFLMPSSARANTSAAFVPSEAVIRSVEARNPAGIPNAAGNPSTATNANGTAENVNPRFTSRACNFVRPRFSRPFTEPAVQPSCRAASSCVRPSRWHKIKGRR
jgi:hypothetical protein